jgi:hypothetical protein
VGIDLDKPFNKSHRAQRMRQLAPKTTKSLLHFAKHTAAGDRDKKLTTKKGSAPISTEPYRSIQKTKSAKKKFPSHSSQGFHKLN